MPFDNKKLTCNDGGGQRLFLYETEDTAADVAAPGYFNGMWEHFRLLDVIHVVSDVVLTPPAPGVQGTGAPQASPHLAAGTLTTYFVSQINDGGIGVADPRALPDVRLTASA